MRLKNMPPLKPQEKLRLQPKEAEPESNVATFQGFERGALVFIKLPHERFSGDFALASRNLAALAADAGVVIVFFAKEDDWEALPMDDRSLAEAGLARIPER